MIVIFTMVCIIIDIQDCCATSGHGLVEGLSWLKEQTKGVSINRSCTSSNVTREHHHHSNNKERNRLQSSWISFSNYLTRASNNNNSSTADTTDSGNDDTYQLL